MAAAHLHWRAFLADRQAHQPRPFDDDHAPAADLHPRELLRHPGVERDELVRALLDLAHDVASAGAQSHREVAVPSFGQDPQQLLEGGILSRAVGVTDSNVNRPYAKVSPALRTLGQVQAKGTLDYHALQMKFQRRFANNF